MIKLIMALFLVVTFSANARTRMEKIKNLDRQAYIKIYKAQVEFILEWEKNNTKFPNFSSDSEKVSFINRNLNSWSETFISSAFAAEGAGCFFGGWPSKIGANGKCRLPWQTRAHSTSLGLPGYGPACGGTLFRCNPSLFGGKGKAPCVESSGGYKDITKSCQEKINEIAKKDGKASWLEGLSDEEFQDWAKSELIPLHAQIAKFCSGSNEPYNDKTCETLNGVVKTAADEAERRLKKQEPQGDCSTADGKKYKDEEKETQKFYQETESETCPSVEKSRLCRNGKWEEWVGDKSYIHSECKTKSAPVNNVTEPEKAESPKKDSPDTNNSKPQVSDVNTDVTIPNVPLTDKKPVLGSVELGATVKEEEGRIEQPKPEVTIPEVPLTEKKPVLGSVELGVDDNDDSGQKTKVSGVQCSASGLISKCLACSAPLEVKCGNKQGYIKNDTKVEAIKILITNSVDGSTREVILKDPPGSAKDYFPLINNEWVRMRLDLKDGESIDIAENGLVFEPSTMLYEDDHAKVQIGSISRASSRIEYCVLDGEKPLMFSFSDGCGAKKMCSMRLKCKFPNEEKFKDLQGDLSARAFCPANLNNTCPAPTDCALDTKIGIETKEKVLTKP